MRLITTESTEHDCGYFDDRQALFESYLIYSATPEEREVLLASGYRAFGRYTFRPQCNGCQRCVPLRVLTPLFSPNKSQRRVLKKCREITVVIAPPTFTAEKFAIYQDHSGRFPKKEEAYSEESFRFSFYESSVPTHEFCYYLGETLIAVGIVHHTPLALSSVYFTYRQEYSHLSLGTFSVLKEIEYAQQQQKSYLYLGYYIRDNHFMSYKGSFYPSEVLTGKDGWTRFRDEKGEYHSSDAVTFTPFPVISREKPS